MRLKSKFFSLVFPLFWLFRVQKNKIICINFNGNSYGDSPKSITEYILNNNLNYQIVWATKNISDENIPSKIKKIKIGTFKYLYELATSEIWINNSRFPYYVKKRKKQFYIQTWHGGLGLKKIEANADNLSDSYIKIAKHDSKMIDIIISNSKYRTEQYKKYFWYKGKILESGLPRNDIFFLKNKNEKINDIKMNLNIENDIKIILYAPTFRTYNFNYFDIDFKKLIKKLEAKTKKRYVVLLRLHPNLYNKIEIPLNKSFIDVSKYNDTEELLLISDLVISDYSSIFFDFLYTKNPVYLYAPDYDKYIKNRGLNFEYKDLPFSISYSKDELINHIVNEDSLKYQKKLDDFLEKAEIYDDGNASEKIIKIISERSKENGKKI